MSIKTASDFGVQVEITDEELPFQRWVCMKSGKKQNMTKDIKYLIWVDSEKH